MLGASAVRVSAPNRRFVPETELDDRVVNAGIASTEKQNSAHDKAAHDKCCGYIPRSVDN